LTETITDLNTKCYNQSMLILGIDPGTATTGYGLVETNGGSALAVVKYGLIETGKDGTPEKRLAIIHRQLTSIIDKYKPDVMAIEMLFFATNAKTAMRVGQACGAIMLSAAHSHLPLVEYAPGKIKKTVTGSGRADKDAIQKSVREHLGAAVRKVKGKKTHFDNTADALAVAICHIKELEGVITSGQN